MKKFSILFLLGASLFASTGCLKDKDYGDQKYGIQVDSKKAVAFTQASISPVTIGITGQPAPLTVQGPLITIEGAGAASSDITMQLSFDDALVIAQGLTPLPAGTYSLNTMTATIKAGQKFDTTLKLIINNSDQLDPNIKYGVGIRMSNVAGGNGEYQIASNMSGVVIGFAIKNKYDGIYTLRGYHNRSPYTFPYQTTMHMITNGPNEVYFYWPEVKSVGHPIGISPTSMSWYGPGIAPSIVFNNATNLVTDVYNLTPGTPITMYTGAPAGVSRFEENSATDKKIYVYWNYNNNPLRAFFDTLTYVGPRP